jgi:hypothetical protein
MSEPDHVTHHEYERDIAELRKEVERLRDAMAIMVVWKSNLEGRMTGWTSVAVLLGLASLCLGIWSTFR